ncbi:hypothetical protein NUU61_003995 [Penicillium alfredii]|uniref:Uncharacterized protein n=1 Tax=Penicillium alfredii TaxID=1506179 RepID=A0A9W9KDH8_9EURO|nr:uncharacterized protein NUU61_003995 [Penicillium alfredii]KAJ5101773.1 hypothetical protein NUU61_003995 [Penicillium alfredii]
MSEPTKPGFLQLRFSPRPSRPGDQTGCLFSSQLTALFIEIQLFCSYRTRHTESSDGLKKIRVAGHANIPATPISIAFAPCLSLPSNIMPPHLHPRSRSTTSLFAGTLLASLLVVGMPHVFPCPAPRRTFADSEMMITADGQQVPRVRRRRRKDVDREVESNHPNHPTPSGAVDEEVSTFLQMEEEAEKLAHIGRECPVPKPKGILGELLGFRNAGGAEQRQTNGPSEGDR